MHEKSEMFEAGKAGSLNHFEGLKSQKKNVIGDFCGIFYLKYHFKLRCH